MAKKILTPGEMTEARRLYEREGWGYGRIATKYSVSKPTVQGWARNWQRDYGVAPLPAGKRVEAGKGARVQPAKVTEHTVAGETQGAATYRDMVAGEPARVVDGVYVAPTAQPTDYLDEIRIPDGLDELDREEFVKAAIVARQRSINARHLKELQAARTKLYASLKAAGTKDGPGAALASQRNIAALVNLQQAEMDAELQRVRLEVAEFVGKPLKPTPARIIVHMQEGAQIGVAEVYGPNAFEVVDQQGKVI